MKTITTLLRPLLLIAFIAIYCSAMAQEQEMQYYRPNDQTGINAFETTKNDSTPYEHMKVKVGGNFTQDFQGLSDQNTATSVLINNVNINQLMPITDGFNLASANLNIDAQLDDGVRLSLTAYLSSRHHEESWVKGGYIQFDKLPFFKSDWIDNIMKYITIKVGDYEVDYGDQHFRRTDGGNTIYNPFVENYIMDEFATEVGGEIYYHSKCGIFAMGGITTGQLDPTIVAATKIDSATGEINKYDPAFHGKIGYDKQFNNDFRFRLTGSIYALKSGPSNTLFGGDRTGSHYFFVLENTLATSDGNAFSGRFNPGFKEQVTAFMINPFIKFHGLELFGTYEVANGRNMNESDTRTATQYAVDLLYRFPASEKFWIGGRYNSVTATLQGITPDVTINRIVGSLGWFLTKNIMLKAEYVNQQYNDFATTDIRNGGKFDGYMIEASVGF